MGCVVVAAGFFVYAISGRHAVDGRVSSWFMVWGCGLCSLGELLVSGLGLALLAFLLLPFMGKLSRQHHRGAEQQRDARREEALASPRIA